MPITRVPYPSALPTVQNDYVLQNNLLITNFYRVNEPAAISGANVTKGAVFQIGGVIYYTDADTAIGGAASNYVKIAPAVGGATCTATYVANLAGVSWNQAYNGYYDAGGALYVFDEGRALQVGAIAVVVQRYLRQDRTGDVYVGRDVIGGRNIDIRGAANGDRTLTFASDASIAWKEATDELVFNKTLSWQNFGPITNGTLALGATYVIPHGLYMAMIWSETYEWFNGGTWYAIGAASTGSYVSFLVYSDGTNFRFKNPSYNGNTSWQLFKLS